MKWIVIILHDRGDHVRPVESATAAAEVILAIVVELKGLTALQRYRAVDAPSIPQTLHAAGHLGNFVAEDPGETFGEIEVRRPVFELGIVAVLRLGGVGLEVLAVAGVIQ